MDSSNSASSSTPSNSEIMSYLKKMNEDPVVVTKKVEKLDDIEKKVASFEKEMTKMWNFVQNNITEISDRINRAEDKIETVDYSLGLVSEKVVQLEKERDTLKDNVTYLQSQSMRNNLVFACLPEAPSGETEDCEKTLRDFLTSELKISQDLVDKLSFERVHRMGQPSDKGPRIVAKFTLFKDSEMVRKQWKALDGTDYYMHEQLPKEIVNKRRKLLPKLKQAKKKGKKAWFSYDTLYIDDKPWTEGSS